jgi:MoaA/NifB/PqqE/SkfB family radical SAM enzyme
MCGAGYYLSRVWLGSNVHAGLLPRVPRPSFANLKLTENCQARCISCDYWKSQWRDAIDTARAIDLINQMGDLGIRTLRFTGGEPLLRRDLFEILKKANTSPFKNLVVQTNGLLIKKLHKEISASPITNVCVSVDGLKETNDLIRGIRGYFDLAMEGLRLVQGKQIAICVTLNGISAGELHTLAETARALGATVYYNMLDRKPYFFRNADIVSMWPAGDQVAEIVRFVRDMLKLPPYEVDYIARYYRGMPVDEPPCVLGFLEVFLASNGDVLSGCHVLKPVGNILKDRLETILASEAYNRRAISMIRRECPGCTCGVETSLAMKHFGSAAFFELNRLVHPRDSSRSPAGR